ncbi:MAG TPA: hypothetical protein VFD58_09045 [Blastocatellia bacterium]|nr:hypothetical protein [Blastocatellia bacterium]
MILMLTVTLLLPQANHPWRITPEPGSAESRVAQEGAEAEKAWRAFFPAFRKALRHRDRAVLKKMMVPDFHFSGGGGDDNHDGDSRDEAFQFWDEYGGWVPFEKVLAEGTVQQAKWWTKGRKDATRLARVAPPAANRRINVRRGNVRWYAIFESRKDGRWYCTAFNQCCD